VRKALALEAPGGAVRRVVRSPRFGARDAAHLCAVLPRAGAAVALGDHNIMVTIGVKGM